MLARSNMELARSTRVRSAAAHEHEGMTNLTVRSMFVLNILVALTATVAGAQPVAATAAATASAPEAEEEGYRLGAYAEVDVGILAFLKQGTAIAGGVTYGPFRAGLSYASFLSNPSLGGVPGGFNLRVNYLLGINAAYFIGLGQSADSGLYVQTMLHIKQQGVTNKASGAHVDLDSVALGLELGYVWKVYRGLYVAPRVGALYYVDKPQPGNDPVTVGDRQYDNGRHKDWDTYFIPTLSVGYAW